MNENEEGLGQSHSIEMESDAEYQRQLTTFINCSTEKGIELVKIGEVFSELHHRRSFLDIGAGGGDLTIPISQSFEKTTIVEPNEKQVSFFHRRYPNFTVYNNFWEDIDLGPERYDFILCSHILYYIQEGRWASIIDKMYAHLESNGRIAIVLQSPIGEVATFFNQFTSYDVNVLELWRELIRRYGDSEIDVRYFMNEIWTDNLEDMVTIGLFLLIDAHFKKFAKQMSDYFEAHHKTDTGYRLMQDEILLTVKKS